MTVKQLYTNCLSEAAYFIADNGEAAVIDPLRDIDTYLQVAAEHNATIKYIFETHFHADFVSGHLDLAKATGAQIVYGKDAKAKFDFYPAKDGEIFTIGNLKIKAIHTPGHTLESTCYLLFDENNNEHCIFTGDTLFIGDVGRPDLFSGNLSKEELAGMLFDTLNNKIKTLPTHIIVYPAHGPGAACGKNLGNETFSTLETQLQTNYALQDLNRQAFIDAVTEGLTVPPAYFSINAAINARGYDSLEDIKNKALKPLSIEEFEAKIKDEVIVLDTRNSLDFTLGFIPQSINIGLEGRFAEWAGSILPYDKEIILITEKGKENESVIRLARVGIDNVTGYLLGGFEAWQNAGKKIDMIIDVTAEELAMDIPFDLHLQVLDVRKVSEFENGHIPNAQNIPLNELTNPLHLSGVEDEKNIYVHCAGGYRSVIACSILKKEGFHNIRNVLGGFGKIKEQSKINIVTSQSAGMQS